MLKIFSAQAINQRRQRTKGAHVWAQKFNRKHVETENDAARIYDYINQNQLKHLETWGDTIIQTWDKGLQPLARRHCVIPGIGPVATRSSQGAAAPCLPPGAGFDVVIGNPPYVRQEMLGTLKQYFRDHYETYHAIADLYVYFIERGVSLLRQGGIFSYIVANKWLRANYAEPLRRWMKQQGVEELVDFGDLPVFQTATTYPCLIRISRGVPKKCFQAVSMTTLDVPDLCQHVAAHRFPVRLDRVDDSGWALVTGEAQRLLEKLQRDNISLHEYVNGEIYRGLITGLNKAFVLDRPMRDQLIAEDPKSADIIKPFVAGKDVKRYQRPQAELFLILIPKGWTVEHSGTAKHPWKWLQHTYPAVARHLEPYHTPAEKRCDKGDYWWELRACDYYEKFEKPKVIYPNICKKPEFTFDESGLYTNQKCFIIPVSDTYLLGVLNSSLVRFLFRCVLPKLRGGFYEPSLVYFSKFPVCAVDSSQPAHSACRDQIMELVERMLSLHKQLAAAKTAHDKTVLQRQIASTDRQIDQLVYELYGLTDEEIKIVEEGSDYG
jgi:hypothetical protein